MVRFLGVPLRLNQRAANNMFSDSISSGRCRLHVLEKLSQKCFFCLTGAQPAVAFDKNVCGRALTKNLCRLPQDAQKKERRPNRRVEAGKAQCVEA